MYAACLCGKLMSPHCFSHIGKAKQVLPEQLAKIVIFLQARRTLEAARFLSICASATGLTCGWAELTLAEPVEKVKVAVPHVGTESVNMAQLSVLIRAEQWYVGGV